MRNQIFYRVDRIRQTVHFVGPLGERNVQLQAVRAPKDFELGVLAAPVHIQALTEQGKTSSSYPIYSDNDVLNFQARLIRRSPGNDIGDNYAVIPWQVQTGSQFRRNGLKDGSDFRLVDMAIFHELRIGKCHNARGNGKA